MPASDRPTRQQLDELDALMQRMLALPVNPSEELPDLPRRSSSRESLAEKPSLAAESPEVLPALPEQTLPQTATAQATPADERSESTRRQEPLRPVYPLLRTPQPSLPPVAEHFPVLPVAWPFRPLVALNRAYDWGTSWLGPLGRGLRGPGGRALLGWSGVALLLGALAWVAWDTLGWTW